MAGQLPWNGENCHLSLLAHWEASSASISSILQCRPVWGNVLASTLILFALPLADYLALFSPDAFRFSCIGIFSVHFLLVLIHIGVTLIKPRAQHISKQNNLAVGCFLLPIAFLCGAHFKRLT